MMPEKIWMDYYDGYNVSEQDYTGVGTEYIRKDIHEAEVARLRSMFAESMLLAGAGFATLSGWGFDHAPTQRQEVSK